jgi:hypothetical protein
MEDLQLTLFVLLVFFWVCAHLPFFVSFFLLHTVIGIILCEQV